MLKVHSSYQIRQESVFKGQIEFPVSIFHDIWSKVDWLCSAILQQKAETMTQGLEYSK